MVHIPDILAGSEVFAPDASKVRLWLESQLRHGYDSRADTEPADTICYVLKNAPPLGMSALTVALFDWFCAVFDQAESTGDLPENVVAPLDQVLTVFERRGWSAPDGRLKRGTFSQAPWAGRMVPHQAPHMLRAAFARAWLAADKPSVEERRTLMRDPEIGKLAWACGSCEHRDACWTSRWNEMGLKQPLDVDAKAPISFAHRCRLCFHHVLSTYEAQDTTRRDLPELCPRRQSDDSPYGTACDCDGCRALGERIQQRTEPSEDETNRWLAAFQQQVARIEGSSLLGRFARGVAQRHVRGASAHHPTRRRTRALVRELVQGFDRGAVPLLSGELANAFLDLTDRLHRYLDTHPELGPEEAARVWSHLFVAETLGARIWSRIDIPEREVLLGRWTQVFARRAS